MTDQAELLRALQYGDSFFPGGTVAFSWGLETLQADGKVTDEAALLAFVAGQLRERWARLERPALVAAHRAFPDLDALAGIDRRLDSLSLAQDGRRGSRRAGAALLGAHEKLLTPQAGAYYDLVRDRQAPGHLAIVQGLVLRAVEVPEDTAAAVSGHGLAVGTLGAALRLGIVGHIASQRCLAALREVLAEILASPPPALEDMGAFTPQSDIAAMRHETATARLFTT